MNYLSEINAFERWLETNYLPTNSQLLWYKLMMLCNRAGWPEWIGLDNYRLMSILQIRNEATAIEIRNRLIESELILFKKGSKGNPSKYQMISFTRKNQVYPIVYNQVYPIVEDSVYTTVEDSVYTTAIYKHKPDINQTKGNNEKTRSRASPFEPPTLEAVREYCHSRNNQVNPEQFIDHYLSKGWKVGSQPMKDWQAAVRNWERNKSFSQQQGSDNNAISGGTDTKSTGKFRVGKVI